MVDVLQETGLEYDGRRELGSVEKALRAVPLRTGIGGQEDNGHDLSCEISDERNERAGGAIRGRVKSRCDEHCSCGKGASMLFPFCRLLYVRNEAWAGVLGELIAASMS